MFLNLSMAWVELLVVLSAAAVVIGLARLMTRRSRRWMKAVGCTALVCGLLLCLNGVLSVVFRLTLRDVPVLVLVAVGGIAAVLWLLMVENVYLLKPIVGKRTPMRKLAKGAILLLTFLLCMWVGMVGMVVLVFALDLGSETRTLVYEGQLLVEMQTGFLDIWYEYYTCHGPLLRGTEIICQAARPLC